MQLLLNNFTKNEIFRQNKDSFQVLHLLPLRIKMAIIKGKYFLLGREIFLSGLPVKTLSLIGLCVQQVK